MAAVRPQLAHALSASLRRAFSPPSSFTLPKPPRLHTAPSVHLRHLAAHPPDSLSDAATPAERRSSYARKHLESRIVPFSQREVFDVVANVDEYCDFVPWCTASEVTRRVDERHLIADLSVGFRLLSDKYTSVITLDPLRAVSVDVPDSTLFEYLITDWAFEKGSDPTSTNLTFYVEFAFRNPLYQRATDLFFEEVVKQMVGAFEKQCHAKYRITERRGGFLHRW